MEIGINTFHISQTDFLSQDHLVECANEESVKEAAMKDSKPYHPANELEVVKMLRVDARVRVNLKGVVIVSRVLKQTVKGVEHFMRQQEEKFSTFRLERRYD